MSDETTPMDRAMYRGLLYETLATALRPPSADTLGRLRDEGTEGGLGDAAELVDNGSDGLSGAVEGLLGALEGPLQGLDRAHERLFGHTARGKVSPYETEYGSGELFRQSQELADIAGFFQAFGLTLPESRRERHDHASVEFEFLSFLCRKEAYEQLRGNESAGAETRRAERLFLRDHAGRFGRAFARSLVKEADDPFYRAVGELCLAFLASECRELGLPLAPEFIPLRPATEDKTPMACGSQDLVETVENFSAGAEAS